MMLLAALGSAQECSASSVLEDFTDTLARLGGTLEIVLGGNLVCYSHTLETQKRKKRCETQLRAQGREGGERKRESREGNVNTPSCSVAKTSVPLEKALL